MILAPDDVADFHGRVIDNNDEIVGRKAPGSDYYEILDILASEHNLAADQIMDDNGRSGGDPEFNAFLFRGDFGEFLTAFVAFAFSGAEGFQGRADAVIGVTELDQPDSGIEMALRPDTLKVGTMIPPVHRRIEGINLIDPFVPVDSKPVKTIDKVPEAFLGVPYLVGVFYSQDEGAVVPSGEKVIEQRGSCGANMELTRGRRSEPYAWI